MKKVIIIICIILAVWLLIGGCIIGCGSMASLLVKKEMPKVFESTKENILGGIDPATEPIQENTPQFREQGRLLMHAVAANDIQTVRQLLQQGISPNIKDTQRGYTPLLIAAQKNNTEISALLLAAGANVNEQLIDSDEFNKMSPLLFACDKGNIKLVYMLLQAGASIYLADSRGFTPLHRASIFGHQNVAQILLQAGTDINVTSFTQTTPLMVAAYEGQVAMVRFLLQQGANPYLADKDGNTALDYARYSHSPNKQQLITLLQQTKKRI